MSNDLDRDLRDMFRRHEADMAGRGLTPPPGIQRRTRRRQASTILIASMTVVIVAIAALTGVDAIQGSDPRPAVLPPGPAPKIDWGSVPKMSVEQDAVVNIRTGEVTALPAGLRSWHKLGGYAVAPAGDAILFEGGVEPGEGGGDFITGMLYIADVDGSNFSRLHTADKGAPFVTTGAWSPDGTKIVALAGEGISPSAAPESQVDLVVIDAASTQTRVLASGSLSDFEQPTFSPDGRRILFSRFANRPFRWDLYQIPVEGGDISLVLRDRGYPRFSPDGGTMVFTKFRTEWHGNGASSGPELWLANGDGSGPRRLVIDEPFNSHADWSPDGSHLLYSRRTEFVRDLVVVLDMQTSTPTLAIRTTKSAIGVWLDDETILVDVNQ